MKNIKPYFLQKIKVNKTCHRDRIARLTVPCPSHKKNFNVKLFVNADADVNANADVEAWGSTIALHGLRPGKLKIKMSSAAIFVWRFKG